MFNGIIRKTVREIICNSNRCKYSIFHDAVFSWNPFIKHFDMSQHLTCYKNISPIFDIQYPVGLRYLF